MYESDTGTVTTALQSSSTAVFTDDTISKILALTTTDNTTVSIDTVMADSSGNVTVPSGAEVVLVNSSDTQQTTITPPANAPVLIFQGLGGVVATINDGSTTPTHDAGTVDRVVVGSAGGDTIIIADARNTQVVLGSGDSSVQTGHGVDTVQAGLGNSTIVGGDGDYAVVKLAGNATNYQVTAQNGHAIVTDNTTHKTTDVSKIQYVQLDNGNALVFAKDSIEGQVSTLYHTAFGRDADASGLDYWFDLAKGGATLKQIADAFVNSSEYASHLPETDTAFVQELYQNTFGRTGEDAGVAYWLDSLAHGATRADLIASFATIAVQNIMHEAPNQEAQIVGNVTIVTGII